MLYSILQASFSIHFSPNLPTFADRVWPRKRSPHKGGVEKKSFSRCGALPSAYLCSPAFMRTSSPICIPPNLSAYLRYATSRKEKKATSWLKKASQKSPAARHPSPHPVFCVLRQQPSLAATLSTFFTFLYLLHLSLPSSLSIPSMMSMPSMTSMIAMIVFVSPLSLPFFTLSTFFTFSTFLYFLHLSRLFYPLYFFCFR